MSIDLDSIESAVAKQPPCIVARIIAEHDEGGRLAALFADKGVSSRELSTALARQGVHVGKTAIQDHRKHQPCP